MRSSKYINGIGLSEPTVVIVVAQVIEDIPNGEANTKGQNTGRELI
jgi:hypothetical protein